MSDVELTTALRALGARLEETPDLVDAVAARLDARPSVAGAARATGRGGCSSSHSRSCWRLRQPRSPRPTRFGTGCSTGASTPDGSEQPPRRRPRRSPSPTSVSRSSRPRRRPRLGQPLPRSTRPRRPERDPPRARRDVRSRWSGRPGPTTPSPRSFPGVGALLTIWPDRLDHRAVHRREGARADQRGAVRHAPGRGTGGLDRGRASCGQGVRSGRRPVPDGGERPDLDRQRPQLPARDDRSPRPRRRARRRHSTPGRSSPVRARRPGDVSLGAWCGLLPPPADRGDLRELGLERLPEDPAAAREIDPLIGAVRDRVG